MFLLPYKQAMYARVRRSCSAHIVVNAMQAGALAGYLRTQVWSSHTHTHTHSGYTFSEVILDARNGIMMTAELRNCVTHRNTTVLVNSQSCYGSTLSHD